MHLSKFNPNEPNPTTVWGAISLPTSNAPGAAVTIHGGLA